MQRLEVERHCPAAERQEMWCTWSIVTRENEIQWDEKIILDADVLGIMDVFKDLLKAMRLLSRNMHIGFQFRKFTDFQKPL